jgi:glycine/D-amino acid oxidase-like deaminating enzyme
MDLTERHDLKTGTAPWDDGQLEHIPSDDLPNRTVDVAIVGAGITGAMLAERLTAAGLGVALVDRRRPGHGSTAASTALVLWEADVPLTHLARNIGDREAVRAWQRLRRAANNLWQRFDEAKIKSDHVACPSVYLAGDVLDADGLRAEAALRARHGMPSVYLEPQAVAERFGLSPRAAIVSDDSFEANPLRLTLALLDCARKRGATVAHPFDVTRLSQEGEAMLLVGDKGEIRARHVILATGYERPPLFLPQQFSLNVSYAIATERDTASLWRENAMLWEASKGYLYARSDREGRVIAGGSDEHFYDAAHRDALIPEKSQAIANNLERLTGATISTRDRWAAIFGTSPDGLAGIGRAQGQERLWLASGFGGNGITFAALAAELITAALMGKPDPDMECFDPYRFG